MLYINNSYFCKNIKFYTYLINNVAYNVLPHE